MVIFVQVEIFKGTLVAFIVTTCCVITNFLLTCFHLQVYSVPQQKNRLLNIFYSHLAAQWQIDTVICSVNIIVKIVCELENPWYDAVMEKIMEMDYMIGGFYFVAIGIARNLKHFNSELYLDLGEK